MIQYYKLKKEGKTVQLMVTIDGKCIKRYGIDFHNSDLCVFEHISLDEFREIGRKYSFFINYDEVEPISAIPTPPLPCS